MKTVRRGVSILLLGSLGAAGARNATAADAPTSRAAIFALMHKVNQWQVENPVMPADNRNWERAMWYTGVMSAWKETRDPRFFDQAMAWGREHKWQVGTEYAGANR